MNRFKRIIVDPFKTLKNKTFGKLFVSQTVSLFGDAFTWLGLALFSYELNPTRSAVILATALTLRVTAYIVFSPFVGIVSERFKRKDILWLAQGFRIIVLPLYWTIITSS